MCVSCETAEMRVQLCVHYTRIYSINRHRRSAGLQLTTQMICEHNLSQFTLTVRLMSAVTPSVQTNIKLTVTHLTIITQREQSQNALQQNQWFIPIKTFELLKDKRRQRSYSRHDETTERVSCHASFSVDSITDYNVTLLSCHSCVCVWCRRSAKTLEIMWDTLVFLTQRGGLKAV